MRRSVCLTLILFPALLGVAQIQSGSDVPAYKKSNLSVDQRVQDLLGRMTLQEKVAMLSGADWMQSVPNERLGIPSIKMADGPMGIRSWAGPSSETNAAGAAKRVATTAFPVGVAMAATWDTELLQSQGQAIAQEMKALGRNMILGPTVNRVLSRSCGRGVQLEKEPKRGRLAPGYRTGHPMRHPHMSRPTNRRFFEMHWAT